MSTRLATNRGLLKTLACPACLQQTSFTVAAAGDVRITEHGITPLTPAWDESHEIICDYCAASGEVNDFTVRPGDALVRDADLAALARQAAAGCDSWAEVLAIHEEDRTLALAPHNNPDEQPLSARIRNVSFRALREALTDLYRERAFDEETLLEIENDDMAFGPVAADRVLQRAFLGEVRFA